MAMLHLEKIRTVYRKGDNEVVALHAVDLDIEKGEYLALIGPGGGAVGSRILTAN